MVVGITQGLQRNQRIQHRRENGRQAVGTLEPLQHPRLAFLQRPFAEWVDLGMHKQFGEFVQTIE